MAANKKPAKRRAKRSAAYNLMWATPLRKRITVAATTVGVIAGAITAAASAYVVIEPVMPALRYYVRDLVRDVIHTAQDTAKDNGRILRDLQIEQAEGKRDATINDIAKWQIELAKALDDNSKEIIMRQLKSLDAARRNLEAQIDTLSRSRSAQ